MEKRAVEELDDRRTDQGISAAAIESTQLEEAARLQAREIAETTAQLTTLAVDQASSSSGVPVPEEEGEQMALAHMKKAMLAMIRSQEIKIVQTQLSHYVTNKERLEKKKFLAQLIDPVAALEDIKSSATYSNEHIALDCKDDSEDDDDNDDNDDDDNDDNDDNDNDNDNDDDNDDDNEDEDSEDWETDEDEDMEREDVEIQD
jgi:hypothetical protein